MTVQQIAEWVESQNESTLARLKEQIIVLDGQAKQITSGICTMLDGKKKFLTIEKLYPDLFGKQKIDTSKLSAEEIAKQQEMVWREFLGV